MKLERRRRQTGRLNNHQRNRKSFEGKRRVSTGSAVRVHCDFLVGTRRLVFLSGGELVRVGLRRMMTEMLGGTARLVLTIGSNHAPAELKSEDRQDKVDEASGGHEEKYST